MKSGTCYSSTKERECDRRWLAKFTYARCLTHRAMARMLQMLTKHSSANNLTVRHNWMRVLTAHMQCIATQPFLTLIMILHRCRLAAFSITNITLRIDNSASRSKLAVLMFARTTHRIALSCFCHGLYSFSDLVLINFYFSSQ